MLEFAAGIARILGQIALFWTNWWLALLCLIAIGTIKDKSLPGVALIRNTPLRIVVEVVVTCLAIDGIWKFPLLDPNTSHTAAVAAAAVIIVYFLRIIQNAAKGVSPSTENSRD